MQEERTMAPITTIVHFEVPADNVDRFFAFWQDTVKDKVNKQPGLIDGIFYRGIDPDGPFQFINVARWDSAEQLEAGLRATGEELHGEGVEMGKVFQDLGVKVSQNNYVEAVRYTADSDPTQAG
jgi:heme-degrading monooxygenase HmoA